MVLTGNHDDARAQGFEETGVVGRLRFPIVGAPEHVCTECLRRLDCHEVASVKRLHDAASADPLDGVHDGDAGNGAVGTGNDRIDHGTEKLA